MAWYNKDGLLVQFGNDHNDRANQDNLAMAPSTMGSEKELIVNVVLDRLGTGVSYSTDIDNDGTKDGFNTGDPFIPAGAVVTSCELYMSETAVGVNAVLEVGSYQLDGTVIDANGFIASTATAALAAGVGIEGAGADIGEAVSTTLDAYIGVDVNTAAFTAGEGKLVLKYVIV